MDVTNVKRILIRHDLSSTSPDEDIRRVLVAASCSEEEVDTALVLFAMPSKEAEAVKIQPVPVVKKKAKPSPVPSQQDELKEQKRPAPPQQPELRESKSITTQKNKPLRRSLFKRLHKRMTTENPAPKPATQFQPKVSLPVASPPPQGISQMSLSGGAKKIFHGNGVLDSEEIRQLLGVDVYVDTDFIVSERAQGFFSTFQMILVWFFAALIAAGGVFYFMYVEEVGIFHETAAATPFDYFLPDR